MKRHIWKSKLTHYGTTVPAIRSVTKSIARRFPGLDHDELIAAAAALWEIPYTSAGCSRRRVARSTRICSEPRDRALEWLLRESRTWALVDGLAASVVGRLFDANPEVGDVLDRWAADDDFWIRRSALLALLGGLPRR